MHGSMSTDLNRVRVEGIDWANLFPVVRLFGSFRMAIHPAKLALGLLLAVLLYMGGLGLDIAFGPSVHEREVEMFLTRSAADYDTYIRAWDKAAAAKPTDTRAGIFATLLREQMDAFDQLITQTISLNLGLGAVQEMDADGFRAGMLGALHRMLIDLPAWLLHTHPAFLAAYLGYAFLLLCLLGGAICRHAALQAAGKPLPTVVGALQFAARRYAHLLLTPLVPALLALLIAGVPALLGGVLCNVPVLDLVGGFAFGLMLLGGLAIALIIIGAVAGSGLMFPAVAVEGADCFDATSRSYSYVIARPWHWLFYNGVALLYGALAYVFVGTVVFLTLWATKSAADALVLRAAGDAAGGVSRLDAMLPDPQVGRLIPGNNPHANELNWSGKAAGWMIAVWVRLLILLLPAFAVSFFFSAQTWIYLLLRRGADGIDYDEVHAAPGEQSTDITPPDKVEAPPPADTGSA